MIIPLLPAVLGLHGASFVVLGRSSDFVSPETLHKNFIDCHFGVTGCVSPNEDNLLVTPLLGKSDHKSILFIILLPPRTNRMPLGRRQDFSIYPLIYQYPPFLPQRVAFSRVRPLRAGLVTLTVDGFPGFQVKFAPSSVL